MNLFKRMLKKYPISSFYFVADTNGKASIMVVDDDLNAYDIFNYKETGYFAFYKKEVSEYCVFYDEKLTIRQLKKQAKEGFEKFKEFVEMEEEARNPKKFPFNLKDKVDHQENNSKYRDNDIIIG